MKRTSSYFLPAELPGLQNKMWHGRTEIQGKYLRSWAKEVQLGLVWVKPVLEMGVLKKKLFGNYEMMCTVHKHVVVSDNIKISPCSLKTEGKEINIPL